MSWATEVGEFYKSGAEGTHEWLEAQKVEFVFWGPAEAELGALISERDLQQVVEVGPYHIYRVVP